MNEEQLEVGQGEEQIPEPTTGLPSDAEARKEQEAINDWNSLVASDPEYMKQFKSLEDFKSKYRELHKQYSNTVREYKEKEKMSQSEAEKQAQAQEVQAKQQEVIMELLPTFMQNDMQLTPEMEEKLVEHGLDIRDVKLGAIELKEKLSKAHAVVGGREEYESMINWARENLSEDQRNAFDKDVSGGMSEFAIRGLYSTYKEKVGNSEPQDRLRGQSPTNSNGVKPYATREEVLKDRAYINSARGRMDANAQARHRARLNITPDSVIF